ncbi:MAG: hypothetical protein FD187_1939 [bacterium]|nr:MAG: hypothetical protein FD142_1669 [bacterium]KAF0148516.1 MAG: hypothetical protein FD187_1939 [bacterium]KAF0168060.1 MAG: hypothetical protein FD158_1787 [bacterium]TXT21194.1 MAG: hypothetical protein FD132_704 [bacterium]
MLAIPVLGFLVMLLFGCASPYQRHKTTQTLAIDLEPQVLKTAGIAFITPSSATGQEEDRQALALSFTEVLKKARPDLRVVTLPETLGAINRAGLASEYRQMFEDYRLTGIFDRETLANISQLTGARYLAQLKLGGFRQDAKNRWGALGIRMLETKTTSLRLYLQIWNGESGSIVWEGSQELMTSHESLMEDAIAFKTVVEQSAVELLAHLP